MENDDSTIPTDKGNGNNTAILNPDQSLGRERDESHGTHICEIIGLREMTISEG